MKLTFILLFCFLFLHQQAHSQAVDVKLSPIQKIKNWAGIDFLGEYRGTFYGSYKLLVGANGKKFIPLYGFDATTLELAQYRQLLIPDSKNDLAVYDMYLRNGVISVFFIDLDIPHIQFNYYFIAYDIRGNAITPIQPVEGWTAMPAGNQIERSLMQAPLLGFYPDSTKLVLCNQVNHSSSAHDKYLVSVFDTKDHLLKMIWSCKFDMPDKYKRVRLAGLKLNSDKKAFLLTEVETSGEEKKVLGKYFYELLCIDSTKKINRIQINLDKQEIRSAFLRLDKDKNPIVAGFYAPIKDKVGNGLYILKIDGKADSVTNGFAKVVPELYPDYQQKRSPLDYKLRYVIPNPDGSTYIIGEQHDEVMHQVSTGRSFYEDFTIVDKTIVVAKVGINGEINWIRRIPKDQQTPRIIGYNSFGLVYNPNGLKIIFNDDAANEHIVDDSSPGSVDVQDRLKKSIAMLVSITPEGTVSKQALFSNQDSKAVLMPRRCLRLSDSRCLLYARYDDDFRIGVLELK